MSGILQQGYSLGYVLAACANLGVGGATESWKIIFWVGGMRSLTSTLSLEVPLILSLAGFSIAVGLVRVFFPESQQFLLAKAAGKKLSSPRAFWNDFKRMMRQEWKMSIYCIILMTWVGL
jgi:hypothetical protein